MSKYITTIGEKQYTVELIDATHVSVNDKIYEIDFVVVSGQPVFSLLLNGASFQAEVYPGEEDDLMQVLMRGRLYEALVEDEREKRLSSAAGAAAQSGEFVLRAPMPGLVVKVPVEEGAQVQKGDVLLILESMKMQNELKSPREGKVTRVQVKAGDSVEQRQVMLSVE
ncbi:MAG: acetyl-CoA carboxylase biotin carboxyl carrier protein subunit [Anaerolineales bacterium]|nr:acetyl-CoA carboxylase biotin carboxyl carrier protein subunit [Anaerolineales bacterium]